ncbi:MAG: glycosyltransferase family 39 protein [Chloroflexota bacterium]|nr:glycosyltransferase family 39 protein [Dehalococcoidia bacterium]MDW8255267.1 glycosyltransferase family 39 protein [Chloroflexota bacterium]
MLLLVILLAAAALRFAQIGELPAGFQHDEAAYVLDARNVLAGELQVFFERSNGREPLYIYALAGSFAMFGIGVWPARIVSAAFGLLTVAVVYRLTADLFGRRAALLAAAFVALAYWPVHVSHTAFRAVTLPLFLSLAALAFWRAVAYGGLGRYALAGAFAGATMYTYLSSRFLPLLLAAWAAAAWWCGRRAKEPSISVGGLVVLAAIAALVFSPLGRYFWQHPDAFALRSAQVNDLRPILLEGDFRPLLRDTLNTLGMFVVRGDESWKYNLSGRPVFDPLSGALFLSGLALTAGRALSRGPRAFPSLLLLCWLVVMLLPGCISGESPHFLRTIGAQPVIFMLPALALDWLADRFPARLAMPAAVAGFALFGALTAHDFFVRWASAPEQRAFFRADYATLARRLQFRELPTIAGEYPYDLDPLDLNVIAGRDVPARWFDGQQALLIPASGGLVYFPAFARPPGLDALTPVVDVPGPGGQRGLTAYDAARLPARSEQNGPTFGRHLLLTGAAVPETVRAGETITVPVDWLVQAGSAPHDLSFSLKLVGPWSSVWAAHDLSPVPPRDWEPGDRFTVFHRLALDPATPPGIYSFALQVYRRETIVPEPVAGGSAADQHVLGLVTVARGRPEDQARLVFRHTTPAVFGDAIALLGYDIDKPVAAAGETLGVTLYWKALRDGDRDLTVFTHLLPESEPTTLYGQRDSQPVFGAYPTTEWRAGEVIKDRYDIPIDPNAPAGRYRIAVGLYDRATGERLPLRPVVWSPLDRAVQLLARLGLPYERERIDPDRVLLRPTIIERR